MTSARESAAGSRELTGRSSLLLDERGREWRIVSGRVDLFAIELVDGEPRGRRHGLGTLGSGHALFGVAAAASGLALLAIGSPSARVEPLDRSTDDPAERARLAEGWAGLLVAAAPREERASTLLRPGRRAAVEAGQSVASLRDATWIDDATGLELDGTALAGAVPLVPGLVVRARVPGVLEAVEGAAAIAAGARWRQGLDALGVAVLAQLGRGAAAAPERERARLERSRETERVEIERVYASLRSVVDGRRGAAVAPGADPLAAACRIAGRRIGLEVVEPARPPIAPVPVRLRALARASGFRARDVRLDEGWWLQDVGFLVGVTADGERPVALVRRRGRYELVEPDRGTRTRVTGTNASLLAPTAYMLYAGLGAGAADGRRLWRLALLPARADLVRLLVTSVVLGLLSVATPIAAREIFTRIVPEGERVRLLGIALVLVGVALGTAAASLVQGLALLRIEGVASTGTQAAVIDRLLGLPASFFRRFTAGDLGSRALAIDTIRQSLTASVTAALVALLVAAFNVAFILVLDVVLGLLTVGLLLAAVGAVWLLVRRQIPHQRRLQAAAGKTQGIALQILGAVPKLRVARAEERAFARWAGSLGSMKEAFVGVQRVFAGLSAFTAMWQALWIALVLLVVGQGATEISAGDFVAFTTAFGATAAAILGLAALLTAASQAAVLWERARPIVHEAPEVASGSADPGRLLGAVELAHVSFRYGGEGPPVLADVSFAAAPGEFVAIVGPSGAGKSTVFRLLLGFEAPEAGTVTYDGQSLADLEARSVRRQLGVVVQNARILAGSIFQNIVGTSNLTMEDAWGAARVAGIAEEIERMPMGMHTFVSDAAAAFSGGQRQRLLIARAVVARPRILLFDEATSSLDNRTQASVTAALDELQATRIVIAHRLSTIRNADRIVALDQGRVVEQGSYDELLAGGGLFAELARRQLV